MTITINNGLIYTSKDYDLRLFNAILLVLKDNRCKDIQEVYYTINDLLTRSDVNQVFRCGLCGSHIWVKERLNSNEHNLITITF